MNDMVGYAAIDSSPLGFAHQRILLTQAGELIDVEYIHFNRAYELIMGKESQELKGQKNNSGFEEHLEFVAALTEHKSELIAGNQVEFERYFKTLEKQLHIKLIPHQRQTFFCWVEDVSSESLIERQLQEKIDQYRLITQNMSDGVALNRDGRIEYFSPSYTKLLGYSQEEAYAMEFDEILFKVHPDDRQGVKDAVDTAIRQKRSTTTYKYRVRQKSGEYTWIEDRVKINYDEQDKLLSIIINCRDINEQVFYEQTLKDTKEKFKNIFENANDGIYIHAVTKENMPGHFIEVNNTALETLGYTIEDLRRMTPKDVVNPSKHLTIEGTMKRLLEKGEHIFRTEFLTKDGKIIPVEISSKLYTLNGERTIISISRDISSELQSQRIQNEQRALLQSVLDALPGKLRVMNSDYKVIASNTHMPSNTSEGSEDEDCFRLFHSRDFPCEDCHIDELEATDKPITKVYYDNKVGKDFKAFKLFLAPVKDHMGNKLGIIEYSVDITELKAAQRKAEEANLAKTEFMMNMSHELRTPLNGILGFSSILASTELSAEQREFIKAIEVSGKNLLNIVSDILNFTKIDANKFILKHEEVDLKALLNASFKLVNEEASKKGIRAEMILDEKIPRFVMTPLVSLNQILNNLLINAVKFTDEGTIALEAELIGTSENSAQVLFRVADTGIGIAEDMKERIFESFTQADTTMTRKYGGIGLGLTITNSLLKLMGSHIELKSTPKVGSVFSFTINFELPQGDARSSRVDKSDLKPAEIDKDKKPLKVLIVEDNSINLKLNRMIVQRSFPQAKIVCASNGKEAVEEFIRERPQIILMDIRMPVLNGFEATEKIRQIEGDNWHTKIIALSADAREDNIKIGLLSGFDAYLVKPASDEEITNQIKKLL